MCSTRVFVIVCITAESVLFCDFYFFFILFSGHRHCMAGPGAGGERIWGVASDWDPPSGETGSPGGEVSPKSHKSWELGRWSVLDVEVLLFTFLFYLPVFLHIFPSDYLQPPVISISLNCRDFHSSMFHLCLFALLLMRFDWRSFCVQSNKLILGCHKWFTLTCFNQERTLFFFSFVTIFLIVCLCVILR